MGILASETRPLMFVAVCNCNTGVWQFVTAHRRRIALNIPQTYGIICACGGRLQTAKPPRWSQETSTNLGVAAKRRQEVYNILIKSELKKWLFRKINKLWRQGIIKNTKTAKSHAFLSRQGRLHVRMPRARSKFGYTLRHGRESVASSTNNCRDTTHKKAR